MDSPYFTIVTATRNDAWALTKTIRSIFCQNFRDFEYIVVDGLSTDGTPQLVDFWVKNGLVSQYVREKDTGVYDAMNKGVKASRGKYICFMNAGDVFAADDDLCTVHAALVGDPSLDGVQGWGQLGEQIWASWTVASDAVRMASLGFCHQSLYLRRSYLEKIPFDSRHFKTDSDTLQLAKAIADGARLKLIPQVIAIRSPDPGISANLEKTKVSIVNTIVDSYPA